MKMLPIAAAVLAALFPVLASANGTHEHTSASVDGHLGTADATTRTIAITASEMAFNRAQVDYRAGETIRFRVTNTGELAHEFVIATSVEHVEHRAEMAAMTDMGGMNEDAPNAIMLQPGETKDLVWQFGDAMDMEFACDIPGHAESGMIGAFKMAM